MKTDTYKTTVNINGYQFDAVINYSHYPFMKAATDGGLAIEEPEPATIEIISVIIATEPDILKPLYKMVWLPTAVLEEIEQEILEEL